MRRCAVCARCKSRHTLEGMFYVYVDVTTKAPRRAFYVGKGMKRRVQLAKPRNDVHATIAKKHGYKRVIVHHTRSESEAFLIERMLIASLKTRSHGRDGHWGANLTDGGDGCSGHKRSAETRRRISEAMRAAWAKRTDRRGTPLSEREKRHLSRLKKEYWKERRSNGPIRLSDEHRRRMSSAHKGKRHSEETRRKISEAHARKKGTPHSAAARRRISLANKRAWRLRRAAERFQAGRSRSRYVSR